LILNKVEHLSKEYGDSWSSQLENRAKKSPGKPGLKEKL
jgi:hypothetical protein